MVKRYHIDEDGSIGEITQYSEPPIVVLASDYDVLEAELAKAKDLLRAVYTRDGFGLMAEIDAFLGTAPDTEGK